MAMYVKDTPFKSKMYKYCIELYPEIRKKNLRSLPESFLLLHM